MKLPEKKTIHYFNFVLFEEYIDTSNGTSVKNHRYHDSKRIFQTGLIL